MGNTDQTTRLNCPKFLQLRQNTSNMAGGIHYSTETSTIYYVPDNKGNYPALQGREIVQLLGKAGVSWSNFNFCFSEPGKYTSSIASSLLSLTNLVGVNTYRLTQLCTQCDDWDTNLSANEQSHGMPPAIVILPTTQYANKITTTTANYHVELKLPKASRIETSCYIGLIKQKFPLSAIILHPAFTTLDKKIINFTHRHANDNKQPNSKKRI